MISTVKNHFSYRLTMVLLIVLGSIVNAQDTTKVQKINLQQLFNMAEENSKAIQIALAKKSVAEYQVDVAKNNRLPNINLTIDAGYISDVGVIGLDNMPSDFYDMPHFMNNYSVEAAWVLYAGGNIERGIDLSLLAHQIEANALDATRSGVRLMLAGLFTDLYVAQNQKMVLLKNIQQTELLLKNMASRMEVGIILESDYIRYELQLSNLNFALVKINNAIGILNKNIKETLGIDENKTLFANYHEQQELNEIPKLSVLNNPEVKISDLKVKIAEKAVDINKSNLIPTLTIFANSSLNRPFMYDMPAVDIYSNLSMVGVNLSFDIGKLYKNTSHVGKAKVELKQSILERSLTREKTEVELFEARTKYSEAIEHINVAGKELELATKNYNLIINQYNNELSLITDVMDASNTKLNAELQLENAKAAKLFSYYKLQHILGIL